jgi:hypothetical protein
VTIAAVSTGILSRAMIVAASTNTLNRAMIADVAASILSRATATAAITANSAQLHHRAERRSARFLKACFLFSQNPIGSPSYKYHRLVIRYCFAHQNALGYSIHRKMLLYLFSLRSY